MRNYDFSLSQNVLANIKEKILSNKYALSPLRLRFINNKDDLEEYLMEYLLDYPDVLVEKWTEDSKILGVVTPKSKEDALVLRALSLTLLRLYQGGLPKDCFQLDDLVASFHSSLQLIGKAQKIYKIDLELSKNFLPIHVFDEKIQSIVGDSFLYRLISSFLHNPILDDYGLGLPGIGGIPLVGEITKVLFHIFLKETLDREFPICFPGIPYYRFHNEVYVSIIGNEKVLFDEKAVLNLLYELSLLGKINSIGPGDDPLLCCFDKWLFVDSDSNVQLSSYFFL